MLPFPIFSRKRSNLSFSFSINTFYSSVLFTDILLCAKLPYSVADFNDAKSNLLETCELVEFADILVENAAICHDSTRLLGVTSHKIAVVTRTAVGSLNLISFLYISYRHVSYQTDLIIIEPFL